VRRDENIEVLRQKNRLLERENERLTARLTAALRLLNERKGMTPEMIELNLPGLVAQAKAQAASPRKKSERHTQNGAGDSDGDKKKPHGPGHGPTAQPELKIEPEAFAVKDADKSCDVCGKQMEPWKDKDGKPKDDVVDVVHRIPARWIIKQCTLEKCRCPDGCSIVTADGPTKLISGGRYTLDVALMSCIEKFRFHIPIERQARQASLVGMRITSQALWDQQWALAELLKPLVGKIKSFMLSRDWLGADLTPFMHIKKGGSVKRQVWQLACPEARYFEMLDTKSSDEGEAVFTIKNDDDKVTKTFKGIALVDGAAELLALARKLGFDIANCWSHARRNVLAANSEAPGQVDQFLSIVAKLYAIERRVAGVEDRAPLGGYRRMLDLEKLRVARDTESRDVVAELHKWLLEQKCIPGGSLKGGLAYVAGRWTNLTKFLDDPRIPLDNNVSEAGFVSVAQGRRNYVGCRSDRGMKVATSFYTVVESARVCGANEDKYLRYAAETLLAKRDPMLPHEWVVAGSPPANTS
jgi:transposase